ncbi:MAG TPA: hypothetical protein VGS21_09570, partial [Acidimicrobiales bacterium]|nr:hypothetical protein [Acidimicrobiales bacterium]
IIGDQAAIPGKHGRTTSAPEILRPAVVEGVFLDGMSGTPRILKSTPPPDADTFAKIRLFVTKYDVETIVVDPVGYDPSLVIRYLTSAIGRSPTRVDGLDVWYGLAPT